MPNSTGTKNSPTWKIPCKRPSSNAVSPKYSMSTMARSLALTRSISSAPNWEYEKSTQNPIIPKAGGKSNASSEQSVTNFSLNSHTTRSNTCINSTTNSGHGLNSNIISKSIPPTKKLLSTDGGKMSPPSSKKSMKNNCKISSCGEKTAKSINSASSHSLALNSKSLHISTVKTSKSATIILTPPKSLSILTAALSKKPNRLA